MIYLIRSAAFKDRNDSGCTEYEAIYKIGFTSEDSKRRPDSYITENPTSQTLFLIPGGTEQDEKNLHHHFSKYKKDYGREWFSEEPEILDFFKTHTTKESLSELTTVLSPTTLSRRIKEIEVTYINLILKYEVKKNPNTYMLIEDKLYELLNTKLCFLDQSEVKEYFKKEYPDIDFDNPAIKDPPDNIKKLVTKFYKNNNTSDQMRFLAKQKGLLSKKNFDILLNNVSVKISNYVTLVGFERLKTYNYQLSKIVKYLKNNSISEESKKNITESIYKTFIVGERYTKAYIKNKLRDIYKHYKYGKPPKANDLWEYFELKECQITNKETGKLDHAYKIIKQK